MLRAGAVMGVALWVTFAAAACGEDETPRGAASTTSPACEDGSAPPCEPDRWTPDNATQAPDTCDDITSLAIFQRRIAPLLDEERPSSCNSCHLQGTNLSLFVQGSTPCEAMGCLIEKDLVDLDAPESSTILTWIARGAEDASLPEEAVAAEYEGFLEWIEYSAQCHSDVCADTAPMCPSDIPVDTPDAGGDDAGDVGTPDADASTEDAADDAAADVTTDDVAPDDVDVADEDVADEDAPAEDASDVSLDDAEGDAADDAADDTDEGDAEDDVDPDAEPDAYVSVVEGTCEGDGPAEALLHHVIEPWAGRCEHCHEQDALITIGNPPEWLHGEETLEGALWTLGRFEELELLDLEDPEASLLLLKPLSEEVGGVRHGGGAKFLGLDDHAYLDFLAWIRFYAECQDLAAEEGDP